LLQQCCWVSYSLGSYRQSPRVLQIVNSAWKSFARSDACAGIRAKTQMASMTPSLDMCHRRRASWWSRCSRIWAPALIFALWGGAAAAQSAPTSSWATIVLTPSENKEFQLAPKEHQTFVFGGESGASVQISFEQTKEMLLVSWLDHSGTKHVPRINDAGLKSLIRFSVVRGNGGEE
jgi:hypothetical protein